MALTKLSESTSEPITLAEAKHHARIDGALDDAYVQSLITVARQTAEDRLCRSLMTITWRLVLDFFPDAIRLQMPPVQDIVAVQYVDTDGNLQTLDPAAYTLDNASEPGWIVPNHGYEWPGTRDQINAVAVVYTAGYGSAAAVPAPIRHWIAKSVEEMYRLRGVTAAKAAVPQDFADALLWPYRVFVL